MVVNIKPFNIFSSLVPSTALAASQLRARDPGVWAERRGVRVWDFLWDPEFRAKGCLKVATQRHNLNQ